MSRHNGKPLSSHDVLSFWEKMFGEQMLLPFFMHDKGNQVCAKQSLGIFGHGRGLGQMFSELD